MITFRTLLLASVLAPLLAFAQDGANCTNAVPITVGTYTAPGDNYWYRFVPDVTAVYHVATCGLSTCDTKIWVYDHCAGLVVDEAGTNAIAYNDDACGNLQSQVDPYLIAGNTYYIRIGDYQDACAGAPEGWQVWYETTPPPPTCAAGEMLVTVAITPDNFPNEISWDLKDGGGTVLGSGNYLGGDVCVDTSSCVVLTMHDGYGDGILAPGGYALYVDSVLIHSGGAYTTFDRVEFNCPPGFSCVSAFTITEGWWTAPHSDTWYSFTPGTTGFYTITTCDSNTCDTRIWLYDHCTGLVVTNNNEGTIYYGYNECGLNANINAMMMAGTEYWIRIGDTDGDCAGQPIQWNVHYNGPVSGCTQPNACNYNPFASIDDGTCMQWGDPNCPQGPDLIVNQADLISSLYVQNLTVSPNDCYIGEGCLNGFGSREIIRFSTHIQNIGQLDYFIGSPAQNPGQFTFGNCHNHWHYKGYAEYIMYDTLGAQVVNGFKNGFCVLDLECNGGGTAQYGCGNMGISHGCGDIYNSGLDCQWVDVTGVPDGRYTLVVRCNWDNSPDALGRIETNHINNWAQVCVQISHAPNFSATVLPNCEPFVDCAGVAYGSALPDCEGVCNGTHLFGDLDLSGIQDYSDAQEYVDGILGNDLATAVCNDLNSDGELTVTDAALDANCHLWNLAYESPDSNGTHDHCHFPKQDVTNPFDTVVFRIGNVDFGAGYLDIEMRNPNKKTVGYELVMSGIEITGLDNLVSTTLYPVTPQFSLGGQHIITLSYDDHRIPRSNSFVPVLRVHFINAENLICIDHIVDVVNENYVNSSTYLEDACVVSTGITAPLAANGVRAFPNPFHDRTVLLFHQGSGEQAHLELLDLQGRVVRTYDGVKSGRLVIERNDLAPGSYFYRISGSGTNTGRLVVE